MTTSTARTAHVIPLETEKSLLDGILKNHHEVRAAETSAAISAWYAGEKAQRLIDRFGWSERKVVEATGIPRTTVQRYLKVARANPAAIKFGESITEIVGEPDKTTRQREQRKATFGTAEAEYAIKLHRMAESTSPAEAEVATRKLEQFASDHGMAGEEIIERSRKVLDLDWVEEKQGMGPAKAAITSVVEEKFISMPSAKLTQIIVRLVLASPEASLPVLKEYL